jgi:hypothetical protein
MIIGKMFYLYRNKNTLYDHKRYWTPHCRDHFCNRRPGSFGTTYYCSACDHFKLVSSILDERGGFSDNRIAVFMALGYLFQEG